MPIGLRVSVAERLQKELDERGMSKAELARRSELSYATVHDIVSGRTTEPSADKLEKIARALGLSVPGLLGRAVGNLRFVRETGTRYSAEVHDLFGSLDDVIFHLSGVGAPGVSTPRKLAAIEGWERTAAALGKQLPDWWFDLRRQVESGEL